MTDTYNGWTNRETWAVALHIDNDQALHTYRNELCQFAVMRAGSHAYPNTSQDFLLAENLRDWVESLSEAFYSEPAENTHLRFMFGDVGSLWRVNYREIAENWLSDFEAAA